MISFKQCRLFFLASFLFLITFSFNNVYAQTGSFPSIGNSISINTSLNVRDNPTVNAKFLGTQSRGAAGVVVGGPVTANGFVWWNVDYASGPDGWSVENYMVPVGSNLNLSTNNLYFKAIPLTINAGETSSLVYSPVSATSCSSSQFNASVARGGSVLVAPTSTKTYSVTCNGSWGSVTKSVTVTVGGIVPVVPPTVTVTTESPKITLTYPLGGEVFKNIDAKTAITNIRWSTTNFGSLPVDIILLDNTGYIIRWIATGISNTGSFTWFGDPSLPTGKYKISVSSSDKGPSTSSASGLFEVVNPTYGTVGTPALKVMTPVGGSGYDAPGFINILWSATGFIPKNIVLSLNGSPLAGQQTPILATLGATTQSSYLAKLPSVPSGTDYTVSVCDEGTPSPVVSFKPLCGTSAKFSITATTQKGALVDIKANNSDGPITLTPGQNLTLSWTSSNATFCSLGSPQNSGVPLSDSSLIIPSHPFYPKTSTTYSITCNGATGTVTDNVTVNVSQSATLQTPTVTVSANPTSVTSGQPVTISWTSKNATSCLGPIDVKTSSGPSGSQIVYPTQTMTYTVYCYNGTSVNGSIPPSANKSLTVNVSATAPVTQPVSILNVQYVPAFPKVNDWITANVMIVNNTSTSQTTPFQVVVEGTAVTVPSLAAGAKTTVTVPNAFTFSYPGTQTLNTGIVYPIAGASGVGNTGNTYSKTLTFTAATSLPVVSLSATPTSVNAGQPVTISWSSTNSTSCSSASWNQTSVSGSAVVYPSQSTDYSVVCSGSGGKNNNTVSVTVNSAAIISVPAPSVILTANNFKNSLTINKGDKLTLSWSSTGATSCSLADGMAMNSGVATSGTKTVFPNQNPTTYTVTCSNSGGSSSRSLVVTVNGGIAQTSQLNQIASTLAAIQALIIQMRGW